MSHHSCALKLAIRTINATAQRLTLYYYVASASVLRDHRHLEFRGFEPIEWQRRKALAREARRSFAGKVIALYTNLFFELAMAHPVRKSVSLGVSEWGAKRRTDRANSTVGFDIANNEFTAYGSPSQRVTFTSLRDIGRAVARLAILATDSDQSVARSVPDDVRIAGGTVTFEDVRDIAAQVRGVAPARIRTEDLRTKRQMLRMPGVPFHEYIRCVTLRHLKLYR